MSWMLYQRVLWWICSTHYWHTCVWSWFRSSRGRKCNILARWVIPTHCTLCNLNIPITGECQTLSTMGIFILTIHLGYPCKKHTWHFTQVWFICNQTCNYVYDDLHFIYTSYLSSLYVSFTLFELSVYLILIVQTIELPQLFLLVCTIAQSWPLLLHLSFIGRDIHFQHFSPPSFHVHFLCMFIVCTNENLQNCVRFVPLFEEWFGALALSITSLGTHTCNHHTSTVEHTCTLAHGPFLSPPHLPKTF